MNPPKSYLQILLGRGESLSGDEAQSVLELLKADSARCYDNYEKMISQEDQQGLAREFIC